MALVNCPECGREKVSDSAEMCPDCGYSIKMHFEKIRFEEEEKVRKQKQEQERKEKARKAEEERKRAELDAKKREEERIKSVPKPNKPKISIIGLIIGGLICWLGVSQIGTDEWERQRSIDHGNGDPIFYGWLFLLVGIAVVCFVIYLFAKQRERYNLAQTNFEEYQRTIIREQDEAIAAQKAQAEAERIRRLNAPKCPMCQSINIEKISTTSRAVSVATVGLASGKIGKQYKCKNCKHMW